MNSKLPDVSVVVPVHNGQDFVARCWRSVASQTLAPRELVFVDDGSTDDTPVALRSLPASKFAVRVLSQKQQGPAAARNLGVTEAAGALIAFLDIDDRWPDYVLDLAARTLRDHPQAMAVQGLVQLEYPNAERPTDPRLLKPHRRVNLGSYVFRRKVFEQIGLLDASLGFAEDLDFIGRMRERGLMVHCVDRVVLHYLRHPSSMTQGRDARGIGMFAAAHKALQRKRQAGPR